MEALKDHHFLSSLQTKSIENNMSVENAKESNMNNSKNFCDNLISTEKNGEIGDSLTIKTNFAEINTEKRDSIPIVGESFIWKPTTNKINIEKTTCWAQTKKENNLMNENQEIPNSNEYANISTQIDNLPVNFSTKSIQRKKKVPKIEVRQEDFKTVVKISVKETPTPEEEEEEKREKDIFNRLKPDNFYENAKGDNENFVDKPDGVSSIAFQNSNNDKEVYENVGLLREQQFENTSNDIRNNKICNDECLYENLLISRNVRTNSNDADSNYCNVGPYHSVEESNVHANPSNFTKINTNPEKKNLDKCEEFYENIDGDNILVKVNDDKSLLKNDENKSENFKPVKHECEKISELETEKKTSFTEIVLPKTKTNFKNIKNDSLSGDSFDSGTSSDIDGLPTFVQTKNGNVIVTIKNFQGEEFKKD